MLNYNELPEISRKIFPYLSLRGAERRGNLNLFSIKGKVKLITTRNDIKTRIENQMVFSEKEVKRLALTGLS